MNITWLGFSCFKIQEHAHGHDVTIVTDPFGGEGGKKLSRVLVADIVTSSHDHSRHNNISAVGGEPFVIAGPGEFEVKDVSVTGVETYHDMVDGKKKGKNTIFYITLGDIHMAHLGDLKHKLDAEHLEESHDIDVLFVPVGGGDVLDAKQAVEVIGQFDPRIIIPMHYKTSNSGKDLNSVDVFLKAMGVSEPEKTNKLKLTAKNLPQDETRIVILEQQ